jgi:acetylornithine deacetylase
VTDLAERLIAIISDRASEIAELARDLVRLDTTARMPGDPPREEEELQGLLAQRLRDSNASVQLFEPEPGSLKPWDRQLPHLDFKGRPQLIARWPGRGRGRSLIFNGHIDVVSAEPWSAWATDPFGGLITDGRLFGRGACDMKGGIAAMVIAAEAVQEVTGGLAGEVIVNTVTDEESSGAGSLACIERGLRADAAIVPEPTSFDVWVACRGSLTPTIAVTGRPGHAELPQSDWMSGGAVNAIDKMQLILAAVRGLREEWQTRPDQRHPFLAPGTIVPVLINGGEWFVTYPAECRLTCEVMYLAQNADDRGEGRRVQQELGAWISTAAQADSWLRENPPSIEWGSDIPPAELPANHPLTQNMLSAAKLSGLTSAVDGFNSWFDGASFIRVAGVPSVAFGPPAVDHAHVIDESVGVDDLVGCAQALGLAALSWCGGGG